MTARRSFHAALLALLALLATACVCPTPHAPNLTRDTPDAALDFLAASIRARRPGLVYDCLHPDLVKRLGGFSLVEFAAAFDESPGRYDRLADLLESRERGPPARRGDGAAILALRRGGTTIELLLVRRDRARATFDSEWTPVTRRDVPDAAGTVTIKDDGGLSVGPIPFPGIRPGDAPDLVRFELHRDWVLGGWKATDGSALFGP